MTKTNFSGLDTLVVSAAATSAGLAALEAIGETLSEAPLDGKEEHCTAMMGAMLVVMCEIAKAINVASGKPHREVIGRMAEKALAHFPEPKIEPADLPSTGKSASGPSPWGNVR